MTMTQPQLIPPLAAMSDDPVLLEDVTLAYGDIIALNNASLRLPTGSVVGLAGSNGAGKSSLIRCLLGLTLPQSGRIRLLGEDPRELSDAARARLGYVPQTPELIEWMKVDQHLDYIGAFYPDWDAARVADWCAKWDLPPRQKVAGLSLGQKQKLSLLLALGHAPQLLVLDEPVASFDPLMRREFMRTLFDETPDRTVLISSHLLSDLERVISHLVLMKNGRVLLVDEWDALNENLRRVVSPIRLPSGPGVLAQHTGSEDTTAVIDTRQFPLSDLPSGARQVMAMNLDELFVELMS
ncbi:MAG: ABC transporter ATP-binding protein [Proteobacteria bacterium]|nr:ABC transporter ATP-binding protein [Pseudomonadota bacterium]